MLAGLWSAASHSGTLPPPPQADDVRGTVARLLQPAVAVQMGPLVVKFEQTPLDDVLRAARVGSMGHTGDASTSHYHVCLTDRSAAFPYRLWLVAHGEMGGPDRMVTGVAAEGLAPDAEPLASCPELPSHLKPVRLDRGLWIGTRSGVLRQKLGAPSGSRGSRTSFNSGAPTGTGAFVLNVLEIQVDAGRVSALWASKVTTF